MEDFLAVARSAFDPLEQYVIGSSHETVCHLGVLLMMSKVGTALISCLFVVGAMAAPSEGIAPSASSIRPLLIGAQMPALTLAATDGSSFDLSKAMASKPTVLIVYRGGW